MNCIKYVFTIGFNCNAGRFVQDHGLRQMSSPFDWMLIDLESSLKIINNNFVDYLHDMIHFKQDTSILEVVRNKNHSEVPQNIKDIYKTKATYMSFSWYDHNIFMNKNYIPTGDLSSNFYDWHHQCTFIHHDLLNDHYVNTLQNRVNRFKHIYETDASSVLLVYTTKIETIINKDDYIQRLLDLIKINNIKAFVTVICYTDNLDDTHTFIDNLLVIFKKVKAYKVQYDMRITDNSTLNLTPQFEIIKQYFTFNLVPYNEVEKNW